MLLKTDPFYDALDLLVVPSTCQHVKKIGDVWEYLEGPQVFKLGVPYEHDKDFELEYYRDRLIRPEGETRGRHGQRHHQTTSSSRRSKSTTACGGLLRAAEPDTPGRAPGGGPETAISALDFVRLNHASFYADPVAMADALEAICAAVPSGASLLADALTGRRPPRRAARPRLLLTGPNLAVGDYDLLDDGRRRRRRHRGRGHLRGHQGLLASVEAYR